MQVQKEELEVAQLHLSENGDWIQIGFVVKRQPGATRDMTIKRVLTPKMIAAFKLVIMN